jgi:hypothetical protein
MGQIESQSIQISSIGKNLDVTAELDSLLISLDINNPQPPQLLESINESSSISSNLASIAATQSQQIFQELNATRDRLITAHTDLQVIHQQNQVQVDVIDANVLEIKQLKSRTQQLATYSKNQLEKVERMLDRIEQIQLEIFTGLEHFGGSEQMQLMLTQLETSQLMQSRISEIDQKFVQLSASINTETEQFYALTAATIDRADLIRSQLVEIVKQVNDDRDTISTLKANFSTLQQTIQQEIEQQLSNFYVRERELIATWDDLQIRSKHQIGATKKLWTWLSILSVVVGSIFILLIRILIVLK